MVGLFRSDGERIIVDQIKYKGMRSTKLEYETENPNSPKNRRKLLMTNDVFRVKADQDKYKGMRQSRINGFVEHASKKPVDLSPMNKNILCK